MFSPTTFLDSHFHVNKVSTKNNQKKTYLPKNN